MQVPLPISWQEARYALVRCRSGESMGRVLSGLEATLVLRAIMKSHARAGARRIYQTLSHSPTSNQVPDETVLRWLISRLSDNSGSTGLRLVELARDPMAEPAPADDPQQQEIQRLERKLAELGSKIDVSHRGNNYRLVRAQRSEDVPGRRHFEAVNEREAQRLLAEMAQDPQRPESQRTALKELGASFDKPQNKPALALVLLRRNRVYVLKEEKAQAVTPSQLRKQAKKPVILLLVDEWGNPKGDLTYQLELPAGATVAGAFPTSGEKRHDDLDPGTAQVGLGVHPDDWFARGARPVGWLYKGLSLTLEDEYGAPFAKRAFKASFLDGSTLEGSTDAEGFAEFADTPSYPVTVTFTDFDPEDYST
jgi:hypothetical protein